MTRATPRHETATPSRLICELPPVAAVRTVATSTQNTMASETLTTMVTSALEARGVLGKIRAELRASVFSAIHEQQSAKTSALPACLNTAPGHLAVQLVLDLLKVCKLDYSLAVLGPEAGLSGESTDRTAIANALGLKLANDDNGEPLLLSLISRMMSDTPTAISPSYRFAARGTAAAPTIAGDAGERAVLPQPKAAQAAATSLAEPLRAGGPPAGTQAPPSPASPLMSVLPPVGKSKPGGAGLLSDLPPLASRGATVPPLTGVSALGAGRVPVSPPSPSPPSPPWEERHPEERRLDALENKLSALAGLPLRSGTSIISPTSANQLSPLPPTHGSQSAAAATSTTAAAATYGGVAPAYSHTMEPLPTHQPPSTAPLAGRSAAAAAAAASAAPEEMEIAEDIYADEFEEEDLGDDGADDASLDLSSADLALSGHSPRALPGRAPPPLASASPLHPPPAASACRGSRQGAREGLSPLETSMQSIPSVDESMSPGRLQSALAGFDLAESVERLP